jgi:hypothetical protein
LANDPIPLYPAAGAKLPPEYIAPPKRYLRDLAVGEECQISFADMHVAADRSCFLEPTAEFITTKLLAIAVARKPDGYHVTIRRQKGFPPFTWTARTKIDPGSYPVASIEFVEVED